MRIVIGRCILFIILFLSQQFCFAQVPKPHWAKNIPVAPLEGNYIFACGEGVGKTYEEAQNKAYADAFINGHRALGDVWHNGQNTDDIEQNGFDEEIKLTNRRFPIVCRTEPLVFTDEYGNNLYKVFVLIQMSKNLHPNFDKLPQNWTCEDKDYLREVKKYKQKLISSTKYNEHKVDRTALAWSIIPGGGHIYKNHKALGYTIMASDIALLCGGIGCYFAAQTYSDIMDDPTATASEKRDAESTYNTLNSASIVCYSAAAVLYIVNLWTAYTISDNRNTRVSFHPIISPNNKDIAFGIGASFKF